MVSRKAGDTARLRGATVAAATVALFAGCGSSGGSGSACDAYFQALLAADSCEGGPLPPMSEITQIEGSFDTVCKNQEALPGSGVDDAAVAACAAAIQAAGCNANLDLISACEFTGSLAAGAACSDGVQCTSGSCSFSLTGGTVPSCGTCDKEVAVGQKCGTSGVSCGASAACSFVGTTPTCETITLGAVGAKCDEAAHPCASGATCGVTGVCVAQGGMGAACEEPTSCLSSFACILGKCSPRSAAGGPCNGDTDCASGLGCTALVGGTCGTVTWQGAGATCGGLKRCLVGACTATAVCPKVLADGQPCSEDNLTEVCDGLASCTSGKCALPDSTVCK
jgi:hypothetical protein